ncbi:MAG: acyltransferase [Bacteroidetes bacterium]|nr:acyltransferase [Bacteroidota bacterium]
MQLISWLVIFLSCGSFINLPVVINNEVISVFALFIIVGQANVKNRLIPLENRTFDFLGKISYGIYVIHPLVIFFAEKFIVKFSNVEVINYLTVYLIIVASTITLAYVSYNYFEKYFLNLKHKFEVVRSSNSKTISA